MIMDDLKGPAQTAYNLIKENEKKVDNLQG